MINSVKNNRVTSSIGSSTPVRAATSQGIAMVRSSLVSSRQSGIFGKAFWLVSRPFVFAGFIVSLVALGLRKYLFGFCTFGRITPRLNWTETKAAFEGLHESYERRGPTQKEINSCLNKLSKPAIERLRQHVGFALARKNEGITDRPSQESFYKANRRNIQLDDHAEPKNRIFADAVEKFWTELCQRG